MKLSENHHQQKNQIPMRFYIKNIEAEGINDLPHLFVGFTIIPSIPKNVFRIFL